MFVLETTVIKIGLDAFKMYPSFGQLSCFLQKSNIVKVRAALITIHQLILKHTTPISRRDYMV